MMLQRFTGGVENVQCRPRLVSNNASPCCFRVYALKRLTVIWCVVFALLRFRHHSQKGKYFVSWVARFAASVCSQNLCETVIHIFIFLLFQIPFELPD